MYHQLKVDTNTKSSLLPTRSGANPNLVPEVVEEGNHNSSQVKSVIDSRRGVLFAALTICSCSY